MYLSNLVNISPVAADVAGSLTESVAGENGYLAIRRGPR